jgi:hypothetical protein
MNEFISTFFIPTKFIRITKGEYMPVEAPKASNVSRCNPPGKAPPLKFHAAGCAAEAIAHEINLLNPFIGAIKLATATGEYLNEA